MRGKNNEEGTTTSLSSRAVSWAGGGIFKRYHTRVLSIFAALAKFECDIIRERTQAGLVAAKARGVSAAASVRVGDYYPISKTWMLRISQKNGKKIEAPVHHVAEGQSRSIRSGIRAAAPTQP